MARAAAIDKGTAMTPSLLAFARDGRAPAARAARSQSSQARDPVTNRFGPRSSPTSSAKGLDGTRAARTDAAGRLFTATEPAAAMVAVSQELRWERSSDGPGHPLGECSERDGDSKQADEHRRADHVCHLSRRLLVCNKPCRYGDNAHDRHR